VIIYIINHGPEVEKNEKKLYTEAGNSYSKSKHITGQSGSQMNTCNSDGSFKRVGWRNWPCIKPFVMN